MRILPEPQLNIPLGLFITGAVILQSPSCLYRGYRGCTLDLARELTKQIARFIDYWRVTTPHFAYAWGLGSRGLFFSESRAMHKNARAFKAHAFIAHGVGYVKKKARACISHAMHIKARDMKKTALGGGSALF